jgi:hypothetical protein
MLKLFILILLAVFVLAFSALLFGFRPIPEPLKTWSQNYGPGPWNDSYMGLFGYLQTRTRLNPGTGTLEHEFVRIDWGQLCVTVGAAVIAWSLVAWLVSLLCNERRGDVTSTAPSPPPADATD